MALRVKFERLDPLGFVLFAPATIQFLLALEWGGNRYPWDSATIIGLFGGSAGVYGLFLAWEYRQGDSAMIPFSTVRQTIVWSSCLTMLFLMSSTFVISYYLPIYFQAVKNATPTLSGAYTLPNILSAMLSAIVSGVLGASGIHGPSVVLLVTLRACSDTDRACSWKTWILSALVQLQRYCVFDRLWPDLDI